MGVSYTKGSSSLHVAGSTPTGGRLSWKSRGGHGRKHDVLLELHLNKVRFSYEVYPSTTEQVSRQVLMITEVLILDRLDASQMKKFLYLPTFGVRSPQCSNHQVIVKLLAVRPDPDLRREESSLFISSLPVRLNIDQDTLLHAIKFLSETSGSKDSNRAVPTNTQLRVHQDPIMTTNFDKAADDLQARKLVSENFSILMNEEEKSTNEPTEDTSEPGPEASSPIYFRHIIFCPEVSIRIDYNGKRVEMSHGPLPGLLMGLAQLQCSEIRLKKINYRHGILGVDRLIDFLVQEWLKDIKKHQLPKILGGVGPMYSMVQLCKFTNPVWRCILLQYLKFSISSPRHHRLDSDAHRAISERRSNCSRHSAWCSELLSSHCVGGFGNHIASHLFASGESIIVASLMFANENFSTVDG